jgi:hypothetical protein
METAQGVCSAGGASPAGLIIGIILTFCLLAGFTFLIALLARSIQGRKKQLSVIGGLVAIIFAVNSVADLFPGPAEVLPVHFPAMALFILIPLAIVLAGLIWCWSENPDGIPVDAVLCSLIVTIAGFVLLGLLSISGFLSRLVHPATGSPGQTEVLPGGSMMLIMALIVFVITLVFAAGGYLLIARFRNGKGRKTL